jgi:hypothetical protein
MAPFYSHGRLLDDVSVVHPLPPQAKTSLGANSDSLPDTWLCAHSILAMMWAILPAFRQCSVSLLGQNHPYFADPSSQLLP